MPTLLAAPNVGNEKSQTAANLPRHPNDERKRTDEEHLLVSFVDAMKPGTAASLIDSPTTRSPVQIYPGQISASLVYANPEDIHELRQRETSALLVLYLDAPGSTPATSPDSDLRVQVNALAVLPWFAALTTGAGAWDAYAEVNAPAVLPWFAAPLRELRTKVDVEPEFLAGTAGRLLAPTIRKMAQAILDDCRDHSTRLTVVRFEAYVDTEDEGTETHMDVLHLYMKGSRQDALGIVVRLSKKESEFAAELPPDIRWEFNQRFRIQVTRSSE